MGGHPGDKQESLVTPPKCSDSVFGEPVHDNDIEGAHRTAY